MFCISLFRLFIEAVVYTFQKNPYILSQNLIRYKVKETELCEPRNLIPNRHLKSEDTFSAKLPADIKIQKAPKLFTPNSITQMTE